MALVRGWRPGRAGPVRRFVLAALLTGLVALIGLPVAAQSPRIAPVGAPTASTPQRFYAAPTGHTLATPFLEYWTAHEGMTVLGLPVSQPVTVSGGQIQYFQDGALLAMAGTEPGQFTVSSVDVGRELMSWQMGPMRTVAGLQQTATYALQAGNTAEQQLADAIKTFYVAQGGAGRFGQSISQPMLSGDKVVQWFERGRLEVPTSGEPTVQVAPIGMELAQMQGVDTLPASQANTQTLDLQRYRSYVGDGTLPQAVQPFTPVKIKIPALSIDTNIEQVPITDGVMGIPQNPWNVGWYPALSTPGQDTNVVMAGHKDWWGVGPTIFENLGNLTPGDKVYVIDSQGSGFTYQVTSVESVPADVDPATIVDDTGRETLTLITCTGAFDGQHYESRLIVRADRI